MPMHDQQARLSGALAGRYHLAREIGQGGMATVYLARDIKHDRDVAIKVLKPELGAVLGVERFLSEIKVTANLQHPNLLPLFDSGEVDGLLFYVMPFVDGETLRARLEREKQLPVDEAVRLSVAIAQALDYAHRRGVIHRDLKPENILLPDGQPLVADFGIALAVSKAGGQRVTQTGLSLGTPQYMSPEQATGDRTVDARTDVYSLAAMTYEMLTGEPPHSGTTAQAIIARLMTEEVRPLTVLRRSVPVHVDASVRHALEKLAADRFATAGEFAQALQGKGDAATLARYAPAGPMLDAPRARAASRGREVAAWVVAAAAIAGFAWARLQKPEALETPVVRTTIDPPVGERIMVGGFPIAISPLGDMIAYVTQGTAGYRTVVRRTSELEARTELAASSMRNLVFSPDGRSVAYSEGTEILRMPVDGGKAEVVGNTGGPPIEGIVWTPDGTLLIGTDAGLLAVPARGGTVKPFVDATVLERAVFPALLPDGKTVLVRHRDIRAGGGIIAVSLGTKKITDIDLAASRALGVIDDHLIYQNINGDLSAIPFDVAALQVRGEPVVIEGGVDGIGLSAAGTLAYMPGASSFRIVLAGAGAETVVRGDAAKYATPRFSPDGKRIAVVVSTESGADIWVLDRSAGTFTRMTIAGTNTAPEWTADGRRILYKELRDGKVRIMWMAADGSAPPELLYENEVLLNEAVLSADGRWLVVRSAPNGATPRDIFAVDLPGARTLVPMATGPTSEQMPRLSPDGRWLAYQSDVSGRVEVYVRPFPGDGARVQVSDAGGSEPIWDRTGRTLHYRAPSGITAASVSAGASFGVGARRLVLPSSDAPDATHQSYDVSPDGARFLVLRQIGSEAKAVVIHNWRRELREKLQRTAP